MNNIKISSIVLVICFSCISTMSAAQTGSKVKRAGQLSRNFNSQSLRKADNIASRATRSSGTSSGSSFSTSRNSSSSGNSGSFQQRSVSSQPVLKPRNLGPPTGRVTPRNLNEKLTMREIKANPRMGSKVKGMPPLSDSRWKGWYKMQYTRKFPKKPTVRIHYNGKFKNDKLIAVDDFKFKDLQK